MTNELRLGALFLLSGEAFLAIMAALIKGLGGELPHETLLFARNIFGLMFLVPVLAHYGLADLKTGQLRWHVLRALSGVTAMYGFIYVIVHLPLAEAILVKLSTPLWLPLVALLWLGDRLRLANLLALVLGFVGVLFILRPGTDASEPAALVGVAAATMAAVAKVCIRRMSDTEPSHRIVFYFALFSALISAIPLGWGFQWPQGRQWLLLAAIGACGTLGQLLMTQAYRVAKPAQVGPYTYASVVYASTLGWMFWDEALSAGLLVGTLFIVAAGLINLRPEPRL